MGQSNPCLKNTELLDITQSEILNMQTPSKPSICAKFTYIPSKVVEEDEDDDD